VTRRSENTFLWTSLMTRLDVLRAPLPTTIVLMPSA
jgi:hypothetical protein